MFLAHIVDSCISFYVCTIIKKNVLTVFQLFALSFLAVVLLINFMNTIRKVKVTIKE